MRYPCEMTWGNCSTESRLYWGPPSETPHACSGPRRHLYKLHICQECGMLGARIQPSPYSKAGAQLRVAILKHGVRTAAIEAGNKVIGAVVCDGGFQRGRL